MRKLSLFLIGIFLIGLVVAASTCCEKTSEGAWCQNMESASDCDESFRTAPTSCESTSYCKKGCCYDSSEGTCMENTPEKICQDSGGAWADDEDCSETEQCQLGCCLIGDQAAFVTQTRCTALSSLYGLEVDYRTDITDEVTCIASAFPDVMGACVFKEDYQTTCSFITKSECQEMELTINIESNSTIGFHEGYLCSAEELNTVCGPSEDTTCLEDDDKIYFLDTCGNLANVYDANKIDDSTYWTKVIDDDEVCGQSVSNADSATCGNCDYFLGSTCKEYSRTSDKVKPNYGDYICRDLACEYEGQNFEHGETWCFDSEGMEDALPGSRAFRMLCYDNEVLVEPCADYRAETCLESEVNGFAAAGCIVNEWQDCYAQDNKRDCENTDKRDCFWDTTLIPGGATPKGNNEYIEENSSIACYPLVAPGFDFWNSESEALSLCGLQSTTCVVEYSKKLFGDKNCEKNCHCVPGEDGHEEWKAGLINLCTAIGDCGGGTNFIGVPGYNDGESDIITVEKYDPDKDTAKKDTDYSQIASLIGSAASLGDKTGLLGGDKK